ncbi:hypothetical protein [Rhodocaloribacter sp.]
MLVLLCLLAALPAHAPIVEVPVAEPPGYLYRVTLVRAAPGRLLDLIDLYKARREALAARGEAAPFWMRHSQGDQWDLLLIFPMESYAAYYHPDRLARREAHAEADAAFAEALGERAAWMEDLFVYGPPLDTLRARFEGMGFFHVEMFKALPGKRAELYEQREMENRYYAALNHAPNLIFVRDRGGAVDLFTLGFYRDLKHFAESADVPLEAEDRAAKAAGFESVFQISPYLRSLIAWHHDTLAVAIR